ncbi:MAG: hypothetical protein IJI40_08630 [Firmicutes bacterium]|nr:hypothetical protein [Bacillota bacterium]
MITVDGYSLLCLKNENKIIISLPQTWDTLTNTMEQPVERRTEIDDSELIAILLMTKYLFERKEAEG